MSTPRRASQFRYPGKWHPTEKLTSKQQPRKAENNASQVKEQKEIQPRILDSIQMSLKTEGEIKNVFGQTGTRKFRYLKSCLFVNLNKQDEKNGNLEGSQDPGIKPMGKRKLCVWNVTDLKLYVEQDANNSCKSQEGSRGAQSF